MKILKLIILCLILTATNSFAETKQEIAKCALKKSDAARLICYDNLARTLGVDKPITKIGAGKGAWRVREEISQIDDSVNVFVSVDANETIGNGYKKSKPSLYVRCLENKTEVFIVWGQYLGLDETDVLIRFDKNKATTEPWSISTARKTTFVNGSDIAFAKKLMKHEKLLAQVTPYGESPVMATFNIGGLSEAIKPLRNACHW